MPDLTTEKPRSEVVSRTELPGMTLVQHLEELRKRIFFSILSVVVTFFAAWYYSDRIFKLMQVPIIEVLRRYKFDDQLVYLNPTDTFNVAIKIGLIGGIFFASPFILYQVWLFVSPGLYRHEKRYVLPFMFATVSLFLAGGFFGYKMVYPAALDFLIGYGKQFQFKPMITATEYTNLFMTIMLGLGAVFELPILVFFLALMGVVNARFLWKNFRYSILIIFIIAAIITPTTDILNMCIFAAPMVVLYVLSIGIAWLVHPSRRRARADANA